MTIPRLGVWNDFWFATAPPTNLAAARIIIGAHALWMLLSRDLPGISGLPPEFWQGVAASARWRYLLVPQHQGVETVLYGAAVVSLAGVVIGLAPRVTCLASALLLYHLAPLETIIWTSSPYERGFEISVIALLVLAASPCADRWSVGSRGEHDARQWSPDYNWPVLIIQLVVAQVYLFSGYAKLYRVGLDWISSENLRRWLMVFNQQDQVAVFDRLGPWLAESDVLTLSIAVGAICLDFAFVLALFSQTARALLLPTAVAFHLGILVTMNIAFLNLPQLLVFVNWHRAELFVVRRLALVQPVDRVGSPDTNVGTG